MIIYCKCPNCKHENHFKTEAGTRVELAMESGELIEMHCAICNKKHRLNVNRFYTRASKRISILSGIILLLGTSVAVYFVIQMGSKTVSVMGVFAITSALLIPVWIYGILNKEDGNRVRTFNQSYIKE